MHAIKYWHVCSMWPHAVARTTLTILPMGTLPLLFCSQVLVHLAPLPGGGIGAADVDVPAALQLLEEQQQLQRLDFLGPLLSSEVARGIAEGG